MANILFFLIPIAVLFILTGVGVYLITKKKHINLGRVLVLPAIAICISVAVLFVIFVVTFSSKHAVFYGVIIGILGAICFISSVCALWGVFKKKWIRIPIRVITSLCVVVAICYFAYNAYIDTVPTVDDTENLLFDYAPYAKDSKVAVLEEESTFKLAGYEFPKMDGATALYPVYSAFARAVYPKEAVDVLSVSGNVYIQKESEYLKCSTTTEAYRNIVTGEADIIFVAAPSDDQLQFAADNGVELVFKPVGREAFVFFVNAKNPIDDISLEHIQKIYSGEITKWSELGVDGFGDIRAFQRDSGSGSQSALERLMEGKNLMDPPTENVVSGMGGIISRTADYKNFKNAIGYSFRFYSTEMVENDEIKLLSINGVEPSRENIENGTYPIASEFYAVTRSDASENTKRLVEWACGEQGQKLVEMTGYTKVGK